MDTRQNDKVADLLAAMMHHFFITTIVVFTRFLGMFLIKNHQKKSRFFTTKSNVTFDSRNSRDIELIYICFIIYYVIRL
jgi:hypothetical protein